VPSEDIIIVDITVQNFTVAHLRRRPAAVEIGGFVAGFDPTTTSPYINYATPMPGLRPADGDITALIERFRERGLTPRLEFARQAAPPAVEPALRRAGFATETVHTCMVCTPDGLTRRPHADPASADHSVETPRTDEDYAAIDAALSEAFAGEFASTAEGAARLRRTQENGGAVRFVRTTDGGCAGAASCSAPARRN
jgi:hypothetical protein